jgi:hypothetical protein
MRYLPGKLQQPVQRRNAGPVAALIGQARHDLAGRQVPERVPVNDLQGCIALGPAGVFGQRRALVQARNSAVAVRPFGSLPTLYRARGQTDLAPSSPEPRTGRTDILDQPQPGLALFGAGHPSSSSNSA